MEGSHTLKVGGDLQRTESTLTNMDYSPRGDFGFDNLITSDMGGGQRRTRTGEGNVFV